jgi:hypothetical protein
VDRWQGQQERQVQVLLQEQVLRQEQVLCQVPEQAHHLLAVLTLLIESR